MPETPWRLPTIAAQYDAGWWSDLDNILAADGSSARTTTDAATITATLRASGFGLEADVPGGAQIDGVEVEIRRYGVVNPWDSAARVRDLVVQLALVDAGDASDRIGSNEADADYDWEYWEGLTTHGYAFGAAALTTGDLAALAVDLQATQAGSSGGEYQQPFIDFIRARVIWSDAPPPDPEGGFIRRFFQLRRGR